MDPSQNSQPSNSQSRKYIVIIVVLIIGLLAVLAFGYYNWHQAQLKQNALTQVKSDSTSQKLKYDELQKQADKSQSDLSALKAQQIANEGYYPVTELGIKFKIDSSLKDLVYAFDQKNKAAYFYSRNASYLEAVDNKGQTSSLGTFSIGALQVFTKEPDCQASCGAVVAKLSNGMVVYYSHPQSVSSENPSTIKIYTAVVNSLQNSVKSAQSL